MLKQIQTFFNTSANTGPYGPSNVTNKKFSENVKLKPSLQNDTVNFSGTNSYVIPGYPDLKQHDVPGWEEYYCGPVSAANGILSLNSPSLQDDNLISKLGAHIKTDKDGTTMNNLCHGIKSFLKEKDFNNFDIEYQGVRPVKDYKTDNMPDLDKINTELKKPGFVILCLGFYEKSGSGKNVKYKAKYGHCVNAVGYQEDIKNTDNNLLIINDPYKKTPGALNLKIAKLSNGELIPNKDDNEELMTNQAKGLYEVTGLPYLKKNQVALLEGAVYLKVK